MLQKFSWNPILTTGFSLNMPPSHIQKIHSNPERTGLGHPTTTDTHIPLSDKSLPQPPLCRHWIHSSHLFSIACLRCVCRNRFASPLINTAVNICSVMVRVSLLCNRDPERLNIVSRGKWKNALLSSTFTNGQDSGPEPALLAAVAKVSNAPADVAEAMESTRVLDVSEWLKRCRFAPNKHCILLLLVLLLLLVPCSHPLCKSSTGLKCLLEVQPKWFLPLKPFKAKTSYF